MGHLRSCLESLSDDKKLLITGLTLVLVLATGVTDAFFLNNKYNYKQDYKTPVFIDHHHHHHHHTNHEHYHHTHHDHHQHHSYRHNHHHHETNYHQHHVKEYSSKYHHDEDLHHSVSHSSDYSPYHRSDTEEYETQPGLSSTSLQDKLTKRSLADNSPSNRRSDSNKIHIKRNQNFHIKRDQTLKRQAVYSHKNDEKKSKLSSNIKYASNKRRDSDSMFEYTSNKRKGMTSSVKRHGTNSNISSPYLDSEYLGKTSDEHKSNIKLNA